MRTVTNIAGIRFESYVCNASGPLDTTLEELKRIGESESSAIVMKSCTIKARKGNEKPRFKRLKYGAFQSMGLPNLGYKRYVEFASKLKIYGKPIVASVSGFSVDEYEKLVDAFQDSEVDLIEVNLSCPNIGGKSQVAYDLEQTENVLSKVSDLGEKPIGLKLPPFYDFKHYEGMAAIIKRYDIGFITCINSVGNCLVIDYKSEKPVIKPKKGFGGLSGKYIKPIALANVRAFYELLGNKLSIFGVGGISTGIDAFEFLLAGADAVQVGTTFEREGTGCFARINSELEELLREKGYNSIDEVKGKLKYL